MPTPAEVAALEKIAQEAANNGGMTEQSLLEKLKARASELGSATSLRQPVEGAAGNDRQPARKAPPRPLFPNA